MALFDSNAARRLPEILSPEEVSRGREKKNVPVTYAPFSLFGRFLVIAVLSSVFVLRGIEMLPGLSLWAEDGTVFLRDATNGWDVTELFIPYAGYFTLIPRTISYVSTAFPVSWAAIVYFSFSAAFILSPLFYLLSKRSDPFLKGRMQKICIAAFYCLLPSSFEMYGNITNIQWYGTLAIPIIMFSTRPKSVLGLVVDITLLTFWSLTGPFSAFFLAALFALMPFSYFRSGEKVSGKRDSVFVALRFLALVLCTLTQVVTFLLSNRSSEHQLSLSYLDFALVLLQDLRNAFSVSFIGLDYTQVMLQNYPVALSFLAGGLAAITIYLALKIGAFRKPFYASIVIMGLISILGAVYSNSVYASILDSNVTDGMRYRFPMISSVVILWAYIFTERAVLKNKFLLSLAFLLIIPTVFVSLRKDFIQKRFSSGTSWYSAVHGANLEDKPEGEYSLPIDPPGWVGFFTK